jgi:hypothetical protein
MYHRQRVMSVTICAGVVWAFALVMQVGSLLCLDKPRAAAPYHIVRQWRRASCCARLPPKSLANFPRKGEHRNVRHTRQPLPVSYTVDHRRQRVQAVASGSLSIADLAAYIAARVRDGVYDYDQLIDLSEATLDVMSHDVLSLVRQARPNLHKKPIPFTAIAARQGTATYGLARQLSTLFDFDGASVHIAGSFDEANAWLDQMRSGERHANQQ